MNEKQWQAQVLQLAEWMGWVHYHTHDSRRSVPGFPDLVLVRHKIIYAELKSDTGVLSVEQRFWLSKLSNAGGTTRVWRPRDFEDVRKELSDRT